MVCRLYLIHGGGSKGLGILNIGVKIDSTIRKVPHIGWNKIKEKENDLFSNIKKYFYFAHSFYVKEINENYNLNRIFMRICILNFI